LWKKSNVYVGGMPILFENWTSDGGEIVQLQDDVAPANISNLNVTFLGQNGLTLNWTESTSDDTKEYMIYNGASLIGTVASTPSKLQPLTYTVTGLSIATTYSFTIKVRDFSNNQSSGVSVTIKTYGTQALSMNGTSDYIKLPSMTFDTVELTCSTNNALGNSSGYTYLDARNGIPSSSFSINNNGNIQYDVNSSAWKKVLVNSEVPLDVYGIKDIRNTKFTLTLGLATGTVGTDDVNIFSDYQNSIFMIGKIYTVRMLKDAGTTVVASYNLTEQFAGTSIADASGNGRQATLIGGTWVNG
jgi:hypothetical protein